jgi:hypothetical protein
MSYEAYQRFISRYGKYLDEAPGAKKALEGIINDYAEIKRKYSENKKVKKLLAHEFKNRFSIIGSITDTLKMRGLDEDIKYSLNIISKNTEILEDLIGYLKLDGVSRKELDKKAEPIILGEIAKEHALSQDNEMKQDGIGLYLKYDRLASNDPIEIYANNAAINATWGTFLMNSLEWAPKLTTIIQAFRIDKENNLEIIMENEFSEEKLRIKGYNEGIGTPAVKDFVRKMCGDVQTYKSISQVGEDYKECVPLGSALAKSREKNSEIYGVKITIPMDELTAPSKN